MFLSHIPKVWRQNLTALYNIGPIHSSCRYKNRRRHYHDCNMSGNDSTLTFINVVTILILCLFKFVDVKTSWRKDFETNYTYLSEIQCHSIRRRANPFHCCCELWNYLNKSVVYCLFAGVTVCSNRNSAQTFTYSINHRKASYTVLHTKECYDDDLERWHWTQKYNLWVTKILVRNHEDATRETQALELVGGYH